MVGVETGRGRLLAPLVVGADGMNSAVAWLVGAHEYQRTEPGRLFRWAYLGGLRGTASSDVGTMMLGKLVDTALLASPTDSGPYSPLRFRRCRPSRCWPT